MMEALINDADTFEDERRLRERILDLQRAAGRLGIRNGRSAASQQAVDLARETLRAEYAALNVGDQDDGPLFVTSGTSETWSADRHPPVGRGLLGIDLLRGEAVRVPAVGSDPRSSGVPAGHPELTDLLIVPVFGSERRLGQLYVANSLAGGFTAEDKLLLPMLADHVGAMLETGALIDELRDVRAAEGRLGRLLDESSDEIHVIDAGTGRFIQTNAGARRNLGYTEEELTGLGPEDLQSEYSADEVRAVLVSLTRGTTNHLQLETAQRRKDGTTYPVEVRLQYVAAEDPPVFVSIVHDTTERRELEKQLRQAQKMEAVGQLAGGIAHDFNNMLTTISGYAELLVLGLDAKDSRRADVERIMDAADRAARLTRQLLAFSRRQVLRPVVLDLNEVVRGIDVLIRPLLGDSIVLTVALDPNLGRVLADPGQLEQVLMNLLSNARDAMPATGRLTIETANVDLDEAYAAAHPGTQAGPHVMLALSDTGIGMDAATQSRLFEPFFTTKEAGRGTGLGLATTYGIVKQSGGSIRVYSEPGSGTTFKVYLPVDATGTAIEETARQREPGRTAGGTEVVLLVEDDDQVRDLAATILRRSGYAVLSAADGPAALLVAAPAGAIALLITDVMMPGMRGPELARRLVVDRPGLRVLYISGYTAAGADDLGFELGAENYLAKPFTPESLVRSVRAVLDAPGARPGVH